MADLTLPLAGELPCTWPGRVPFRSTVWSWFTRRPADPQPVHPGTGGNCQTRWLVLDEHGGTHAPRHFIPPAGSGLPHAGPAGHTGIDKLPLLAAAGPADVADVTSLTGAATSHSGQRVRDCTCTQCSGWLMAASEGVTCSMARCGPPWK